MKASNFIFAMIVPFLFSSTAFSQVRGKMGVLKQAQKVEAVQVECKIGLTKDFDYCNRMHCLEQGTTLGICNLGEGHGVPVCDEHAPPCKMPQPQQQ